jgi:hypothetical protein
LYPFPYEVTRGDGLMVGLLSMIVSFFPYFLSLLEKLHVVLLSLNLSILILMYFIAYFRPWFYYKFFKCFQFSSWFTIYHIFFFIIHLYSFDFWFFSLSSFVSFLISSFNQSLYYFIIFNLALILLIYFFFC